MLIKPILLTTPSFDAKKEKNFVFKIQPGGSQVVANQLTIRDQETNSVIYQNIQNTFKYEHKLPANTLQNGKYYNATLVTLDAQGNQSPASSVIQFWCYTTPVLRFTNIPENKIIANGSFNFQFEYTQAEGERLNSYIINLYDSAHALLSTSKTIYVENGTPPYTASYLFAGFQDDTAYSVEVIGETIDQAIVPAVEESFIVKYQVPNLFNIIELTNNCEGGYINISSNIKLVDGITNPTPPRYIDGKEIDLSGDGWVVEWNQGYSILKDFLARAWFRKPTPYSTITQFSNTNGQIIKINYAEGYKDVDAQKVQSYLEVYVDSIQGMNYYIFSNYIDKLSDTEYYIYQLQRINNIYRIQLNKV